MSQAAKHAGILFRRPFSGDTVVCVAAKDGGPYFTASVTRSTPGANA